MKIGEFFVQLGVDADSKTLKEFIGSVGDLQLGVIGNIASIAALTAEMVRLGTEAINTAVGFKMFTAETGLSSQELQKWQIVAAQSSVSTEAVASSITNLQRNLAEIRLGRGNIAPFQLLGISPTGDAFRVLDQVRERIKGLDAATATNIITQMGLSPEMIAILRLSNEEFSRLSKTVRGMTSEQQEQFLKTKQTLVQFGLVLKYTGFDIIGHFIGFIEKLNAWLNRVPASMKLFIGSVGLLVAALFPLQALIVGLLLLLDDLAVYFSGGKSLTGEGIKGLMMVLKELKSSLSVGNFGPLQKLLSMPGAGLFANAAGGAIAGARQLTNNFNISVTGQGAAVDIANEVTKQISRHFSKSEQEFNNQGH